MLASMRGPNTTVFRRSPPRTWEELVAIMVLVAVLLAWLTVD
jgi:hypothetical protein